MFVHERELLPVGMAVAKYQENVDMRLQVPRCLHLEGCGQGMSFCGYTMCASVRGHFGH